MEFAERNSSPKRLPLAIRLIFCCNSEHFLTYHQIALYLYQVDISYGLSSYGLYSSGPYGYGPYSYGLYSFGHQIALYRYQVEIG